MPDLDFRVENVKAVPFAAAPLLNFKLRVSNAEPDELIQTVNLRCQIQIEPAQRRYNAEEQKRLRDLFGEPERWSQTLKTLLWTHANCVVSPFQNAATVDLPVACTFDFNIAATKYFAGLEDGEIPLLFLFSGTCFYQAEDGALQIAQISWSKEAKYRMPVAVWREMMEHYYPNSVWLCLQRDVFERLQEYKVKNGIPTWEQALESILPAGEIEIVGSVVS